jgi:hypothetical protein
MCCSDGVGYKVKLALKKALKSLTVAREEGVNLLMGGSA